EMSIPSSVSGDFVFGRSEILAEVKAAEPSLVEKVEFYVDDKLVFIDKEPPYSCVYDFGSEPRSYVLKANAYHREGVTVTGTSLTPHNPRAESQLQSEREPGGPLRHGPGFGSSFHPGSQEGGFSRRGRRQAPGDSGFLPGAAAGDSLT